MPEGDTLHTLAATLRLRLDRRTIRRVDTRWPERFAGVTGTYVRGSEAVGKHLLLHLSDDTVIRVHLGMTGRWRVRPSTPRPLAHDDLAFALTTGSFTHVCRRAPTVERLRRRDLAAHPVLAALGPDLAVPGADLDEVLARARHIPRGAISLADLLRCQQVAAGIGNVYVSELCFLARVDPHTPAAQVPDATLARIYADAHRLLRANVRPGPRNTTGRPHPRLWVYGNRDRGCPRCARPVASALQGAHARVVWWCPRCQPAPALAA